MDVCIQKKDFIAGKRNLRNNEQLLSIYPIWIDRKQKDLVFLTKLKLLDALSTGETR